MIDEELQGPENMVFGNDDVSSSTKEFDNGLNYQQYQTNQKSLQQKLIVEKENILTMKKYENYNNSNLLNCNKFIDENVLLQQQQLKKVKQQQQIEASNRQKSNAENITQGFSNSKLKNNNEHVINSLKKIAGNENILDTDFNNNNQLYLTPNIQQKENILTKSSSKKKPILKSEIDCYENPQYLKMSTMPSTKRNIDDSFESSLSQNNPNTPNTNLNNRYRLNSG